MEKSIPQKVKIFYFISILLFIISSIILFKYYSSLNSTIVTHVDFSASADKRGDKIHLVYALMVNMAILLLMFFLIKHPKYANYPLELNESNRESAYLKMRYFLAILSLITSTSFLWMILHNFS